MTTMVEIDNELEAELEAAMPMLDALADMSEKFKDIMREQIAQHPLVTEEERVLAYSSLCQMLSMDAITDLAEEIECNPLEVVDTWADAFYEAFEDDDEEQEEEDDEEYEENEEDGE